MITGRRIFTNLIWRFAERCGAQAVSFIVAVVLARLLSPEAYGTIALVTVFTNLLQVFADSGMANALIQKKNADELDFSSVFYCNVVTSAVLYAVMFVCAPYIAGFYSDASLTPVIRVLSLTILFFGVKNVQQAYVSKTMQFRKFFFSTLGGTVGAAVVGIAMAYSGFGVWALVVQQLFNTAADTLILWLTVRWKPEKNFSFVRLKGLFCYGWKLLASGLLDRIYNELRQLIIGKMYSPYDLAFYNQGDKLPKALATNINTSIDSVLLPAMAGEQDNCERVRSMTRRAIKTGTYIMAPVMVGSAVTAPIIVELLLTDKWLPAVPFLRIFCITYLFYPVHTANLNAIKAMGRSDLFLKLELIKKTIGFTVLFITMWYGVKSMAYSLLFTSVINQIINSWPNRKLLKYTYMEQVKDILPEISLAVMMGAVVAPISLLNTPLVLNLMIQITVGIAVYLLGSVVLSIDTFEYLCRICRSYTENS